MSTGILSVFRRFKGSHVNEIKTNRGAIGFWATLKLWAQRAHQRRALMEMDDRMLKDIGVNRAEALNEGEKWFWEK